MSTSPLSWVSSLFSSPSPPSSTNIGSTSDDAITINYEYELSETKHELPTIQQDMNHNSVLEKWIRHSTTCCVLDAMQTKDDLQFYFPSAVFVRSTFRKINKTKCVTAQKSTNLYFIWLTLNGLCSTLAFWKIPVINSAGNSDTAVLSKTSRRQRLIKTAD